ncbi:TBC1 domain family member 13 [Brevipalpus obovatus]|uniref:TBC1 domain family member 13 n=1 Tax=Brevipalpus obovatus TaxID=246614 RepID=UPI003D9E7BFA
MSWKISRFKELFEQSPEINVKLLREFTFETGCPDENTHYRSLTWKILLGYLPSNKNEWNLKLTSQRKAYESFVMDFIINETDYQNGDHPLSSAATSQWNSYFRDKEVLSQIVKDVRRLHPDMSFFQQKVLKKFNSNGNNCDVIGRTVASNATSIEIVQNTFGAIKAKQGRSRSFNEYDHCDETSEPLSVDEEYNWQVVARILFIFAKLNPCQGYIQGMNEIIGPIFYVFAKDSAMEWSTYCEADTFWCFTSLMSEIRDMYNSQLDADLSSGVVSMMNRLTNLLSRIDRELYDHIYVTLGIKPHFHAFRWLTLLLSQEFPLPETLRIWDFLLADDQRFRFLLEISCAMIILLKEDLLQGDYSSNIKLLQNFPERIDLENVIIKAKLVREKNEPK